MHYALQMERDRWRSHPCRAGAEQGLAADGFQGTLLRCSRFQRQLKPGDRRRLLTLASAYQADRADKAPGQRPRRCSEVSRLARRATDRIPREPTEQKREEVSWQLSLSTIDSPLKNGAGLRSIELNWQ